MPGEESYTRRVAEFVAGTRFQDLPPAAVAAARLHILDALGIALRAFASGHALIRALCDSAAPAAAGDEATIVGAGRRVACLDAAMANAVMANFLDSSDGHYLGGHINDRLVPVALAAGERAGASGRDLLAAVAVGYEVYIELARALFGQAEPSPDRPPHFVMLGTLAGVAPAAQLLGLQAEQVAGAMGLAASVQLGGAQYVLSGGHEKDFCPGHEARRALFATLMAARGILGSTDILEGERGLLRVYGAPPAVPSELGRRYRITECYFKPYPACRYLHASIEAAMNLKREQGLQAEQVEGATVTTNSSSARRVSYEIKSHVNAIFSHPYQVAVVLKEGRPDLPIAWRDKMRDPLIRDLLPRIRVRADPAYDALYARRSLEQPPWPAEVEVVMRDGRRHRSQVLSPKGDPGNPMSPREVQGKFQAFTAGVLSPQRAAQIIETIDHLERVPRVSELVDLLAIP